MMYDSKHYQLVRSTHRDLCVWDRRMANGSGPKQNWTSRGCLGGLCCRWRVGARLLWEWWNLCPGPSGHEAGEEQASALPTPAVTSCHPCRDDSRCYSSAARDREPGLTGEWSDCPQWRGRGGNTVCLALEPGGGGVPSDFVPPFRGRMFPYLPK